MKKISTRMLVCILTVAVLCSILAVGVIAAGPFDFELYVRPYGPSYADSTPRTLNKTELHTSSQLKIDKIRSYGSGGVIIVGENNSPATVLGFFKDEAMPSSISLKYIISPTSILFPQTVKLRVRISNSNQGFNGTSAGLVGQWTP